MDRQYAAKTLLAQSLDFGRADANFVQQALLDPKAQFIFEDRLAFTLPQTGTVDMTGDLSGYSLAANAGQLGVLLASHPDFMPLTIKNVDGTKVLDAGGHEVEGTLTDDGAGAIMLTVTRVDGSGAATLPIGGFDCYLYLQVEKRLGDVRRIGGTQSVAPTADPRYEQHINSLGDFHPDTAITISAAQANALGLDGTQAANRWLDKAVDRLNLNTQDVAASVTTEAAARAAGDAAVQANVNAEATARATADTTLQTNITAEATARAAAVSAEATTRANADTALQANITAEATARSTADTAINAALTAETAARTAADTAIRNDLTSQANGKGASLVGVEDAGNLFAGTNVEAVLAEIQGSLTTEAGTRSGADAAINTRIDDHITDLASVAASKGASLIGVQDSGNHFAGTNVETVLAEIGTALAAGGSGVAAVQSELDALEATVGSTVAGALPAWGDTRLNAQTSVIAGVKKVSADLATAEAAIAAAAAKTWHAASIVITAAMIAPAQVDGAGYITIPLTSFTWKGTMPASHNGAGDPTFDGFIGGTAQMEGTGLSFQLDVANSIKVLANDLWDQCRVRVRLFK